MEASFQMDEIVEYVKTRINETIEAGDYYATSVYAKALCCIREQCVELCLDDLRTIGDTELIAALRLSSYSSADECKQYGTTAGSY